MSFKIVQNDIVRVKADAIVNTANPYPVIGDGTDADIYEAAGSENLLRERVKIGNIARGDAKALLETAGYAFSRSQKFDVVIVYCIKNKIYNLMKINMILFEQDLKIFKISGWCFMERWTRHCVRRFFSF